MFSSTPAGTQFEEHIKGVPSGSRAKNYSKGPCVTLLE